MRILTRVVCVETAELGCQNAKKLEGTICLKSLDHLDFKNHPLEQSEFTILLLMWWKWDLESWRAQVLVCG